jgi:Tfp pilus assembly protein PilE
VYILSGMERAVRRPPGRQAGVTLPELLLVIAAAVLVVIFALPQWRAYRERDHTDAMRAALRRLAVAEDSYFYDAGMYTDVLDQLTARGFQAGNGVRVRLIEATRVGWSASASHTASPVECHLFVKTAAPVGPATEEGEIACG